MKLAAVASCGLVAACSFELPSPGGGTPSAGQIIDDTRDEFAAGTCVDCVATAWNTLEPAAFVVGGLHARGYVGAVIGDADTYEDVVAKLPPLAGESYRQLPTDWFGVDRPRGLGLVGNVDFTVLYDGEILLPAGTGSIELDADDRAIVQIALDGTNFGPPLRTVNNIVSMPLAVPRDGWYPIRIAYAQDFGASRFLLTIIEADSSRHDVSGERLRARVTDAPGVIAFGFDGQAFAVARGETAVGSVANGFGFGAPAFDLGMRFDFFSLRYAGQLRVDVEGDYELAVDVGGDPDDRFRLWIDHQIVASAWFGLPVQRVATVHLAPGWHDLIVDYSETSGNAQVTVRQDGAPIDPSRLRPAIAGGLLATFADTQSANIIPDAGQLLLDMPIADAATKIIDAVDYAFRIDNQEMSTLAVDLFDCALTPTRLAVGTTPGFYYFANDTHCLGKLPTPPWKLRFLDSAFGNGPFFGLGSVSDYGLGVTYHGGDRMPFAPTATYVSAAKAVPGLVRVDSAAIVASGQLTSATLAIAVRAAADEAALPGAPWQTVSAGAPVELAGDVLQYRVEISANGWDYPAIRSVTIDYTAR